jgi:hypothetical protein
MFIAHQRLANLCNLLPNSFSNCSISLALAMCALGKKQSRITNHRVERYMILPRKSEILVDAMIELS